MKKNFSPYSLLVLFSFTFIHLQAQQIRVPDDQPTIQAGIDAAQNGDTVLVSPGEYFENLNMKGKNIVLASNFLISGDLQDVVQTIINGSQPLHADTASCILIVSGENEHCVVAGFTLTGGTGTRWEDEHNRGFWYTEGGGILIQYSSPVIRNNIIRDNEAINKAGSIVSAGGGAIRMGDSNPTIINNYIVRNKGLYGAGLVLNYSGGIIRNNVIVNNTGGSDYGGGGIWILGNGDEPKFVENNTIVNNNGGTLGGGIRIWTGSVIITNNIVRGNHASSGAQIAGNGVITYCNVEGGRSGEGNMDEAIRFSGPEFSIPIGNASIDAGNPHASYNDREDPDSPGNALLPSLGTVRNDLGAYGGPGAMELYAGDASVVNDLTGHSPAWKLYPNPVSNSLNIFISDLSTERGYDVSILSITGEQVYYQSGMRRQGWQLVIDVNDLPAGCYCCRLSSKAGYSTQLFTKLQ